MADLILQARRRWVATLTSGRRFVGSIRSRMSFGSESSWSSIRIPNSSQSQARFNPDEPILRPWRGDSQKRHPRSLGLNIHSPYSAQGFDDQALFPLSLKSVTIAFKRLVAATLNGPSWVVWANLLAQRVFFTVRGPRHDFRDRFPLPYRKRLGVTLILSLICLLRRRLLSLIRLRCHRALA
jgi:hypothetical protein